MILFSFTEIELLISHSNVFNISEFGLEYGTIFISKLDGLSERRDDLVNSSLTNSAAEGKRMLVKEHSGRR